VLVAKPQPSRSEILEHSQATAKYVIENHKKAYIIPPLSLNIRWIFEKDADERVSCGL
jgi:hypothetical protein